MTTPMTMLARGDFLRAPVLANARPEYFKEWHHFVVHRPGWRLLVNFSLTNESPAGRPPRLVPRVVVIAHDDRWAGTIERFTDGDLAVSADLGTLVIGRNRMTVGADGYQVVIDMPKAAIQGELRLTPASRPFVVNNQPVGQGRLSWLFVPRLRADGWFRVGGADHRLKGEPAYHDHNWGRFRWGDDFSWEWSSILPTDTDAPWSLVFTRVTDRRRLRTLFQGLFVWHHDEPAAMFRDAALRVRWSGLLARPPDCTLPPPMRLVLGGAAADVPDLIEITAVRAGDALRVQFHPRSYARIALPSEVHLDRSVVLSETSGTARVSGSIGGADLDLTGVGVFELLHG
jgi:hypothetical protein